MKRTRWLVAASCVTIAAGCSDIPTSNPAAEGGPAPLAARAAGDSQIRPEEAHFHLLAEQIPGFGGYFFAESGELVAYVTDPGRADEARAALRSILPGLRGAPRGAGGVAVRQGQFDFGQLAQWRDRITDPVLDLDGVHSVDLDEARNRVVVGVGADAARGRVEAVLSRLAIPRHSVIVEVEDTTIDLSPSESLSSSSSVAGLRLDGDVDPLQGGIQISRWTDRNANPPKYARCSATAAVRRDGYTLLLTASHCSSRSWEDDTTIFYQPVPDFYDYYRIGFEYDDKQGSSCGFLSVNVCRDSDASLVRLDGGITAEVGRIARTRYSASSTSIDTIGSLEIDPANPYFTIVGRGTVSFGSVVHKMGTRTGWTQGRVNATCVDVKVPYRSYSKLRCQVETTTWVSRGDSGGPAFMPNSDGTANLLGVFWGRTQSGSYSYYSPMSGVERDLGSLTITQSTSSGGGEEPPPIEGSECSDPRMLVC